MTNIQNIRDNDNGHVTIIANCSENDKSKTRINVGDKRQLFPKWRKIDYRHLKNPPFSTSALYLILVKSKMTNFCSFANKGTFEFSCSLASCKYKMKNLCNTFSGKSIFTLDYKVTNCSESS